MGASFIGREGKAGSLCGGLATHSNIILSSVKERWAPLDALEGAPTQFTSTLGNGPSLGE